MKRLILAFLILFLSTTASAQEYYFNNPDQVFDPMTTVTSAYVRPEITRWTCVKYGDNFGVVYAHLGSDKYLVFFGEGNVNGIDRVDFSVRSAGDCNYKAYYDLALYVKNSEYLKGD